MDEVRDNEPRLGQRPLRDICGQAIYEQPADDGGGITDWYELNESRREPWRAYADLCLLALEASGALGPKWKPITGEIKRPVIVTNNINARNAHGHMSHFWATSFVQYDEETNEYICFQAGWQKIWGLTHYADIAAPDFVSDTSAAA